MGRCTRNLHTRSHLNIPNRDHRRKNNWNPYGARSKPDNRGWEPNLDIPEHLHRSVN
jgi:transglutaminase/protease-like cytokinesis protein 3